MAALHKVFVLMSRRKQPNPKPFKLELENVATNEGTSQELIPSKELDVTPDFKKCSSAAHSSETNNNDLNYCHNSQVNPSEIKEKLEDKVKVECKSQKEIKNQSQSPERVKSRKERKGRRSEDRTEKASCQLIETTTHLGSSGDRHSTESSHFASRTTTTTATTTTKTTNTSKLSARMSPSELDSDECKEPLVDEEEEEERKKEDSRGKTCDASPNGFMETERKDPCFPLQRDKLINKSKKEAGEDLKKVAEVVGDKTSLAGEDEEDEEGKDEEEGEVGKRSKKVNGERGEENGGSRWKRPRKQINGDWEETTSEEAKIAEYLKRGDTAVIFPEPVEPLNNNRRKKTDGDGTKELSKSDSLIASVIANQLVSDKSPENQSQTNNNSSGNMFVDQLARCPHCGKLFRGQHCSLSLDEHIHNIHGAVAPNSSSMSFSSSSLSSASKSPRKNDAGKSFVCGKCKATFSKKDDLEKHSLVHLTGSGPGQSCQLCNKSFANVYRLQRHMLSHDESQVLRKFKCPECGKAFKFKHHLKEHIRIHSGEKPFACPNCGKRFSHSGSYSSHMTSKKCLVVNLKVRKVDQLRSNKARNGSIGTEINQPSVGSDPSKRQMNETSDLFRYCMPKYGKSEGSCFSDSFNSSMNLLKSEVQSSYFSPEFQDCFRGQPASSYLPTPAFSTGIPLHPAMLSAAAAAAVNPSLPPYFPAALTNFSDMAHVFFKSKLSLETPTKDSSVNTQQKSPILKEDLVANESMKRILEVVDASNTGKLNAHDVQKPFSKNGVVGDPSESPPIAFSASSLPTLPQILPLDMQDDASIKCTNNNNNNNNNNNQQLKCKYCEKSFDNKFDSLHHEKYLCPVNREGSNYIDSKKALLSIDVPQNIRDSIMKTPVISKPSSSVNMTESDEDSQKDSSLDEEMTTNDGKKVRVRSVLSEDTLRVLRAQYEVNPRPKKHDILRLSQEVNYPPRVVQVWFQNMRARDRRLGRPIPNGRLNQSFDQRSESGKASSPLRQVKQSESPIPMGVPQYRHQYNQGSSSMVLPPPSFPSAVTFAGGLFTESNASFQNIQSLGAPSPATAPTSLADNEPYKNSATRESEATLPDNEQPLDLSVKPKEGQCQISRRKSLLSDFQNDGKEMNEILNLSRRNQPVLGMIENQRSMSPGGKAFHGHFLSALKDSDDSKVRFNQTHIVSGIKAELPAMSISYEIHSEHKEQLQEPKPEDDRGEKNSEKRPHQDSDDGTQYSDSASNFDYMSDSSKGNLNSSPSSAKQRKLFTGEELEQSTCHAGQTSSDGSLAVDLQCGIFSCDQCDKTFSKQSSLARHKYEHSGQRPHKCDVCNKAFKHKHHLTEHKRLHSGEKPFQCMKCKKRFSHSGSYSQHMNHRYSYCKPYRE